jgi:hypothetical protein
VTKRPRARDPLTSGVFLSHGGVTASIR